MYEPFNNGQAKACSHFITFFGYPLEQLKNPTMIFWIYPNTIIPHVKLVVISGIFIANVYLLFHGIPGDGCLVNPGNLRC